MKAKAGLHCRLQRSSGREKGKRIDTEGTIGRIDSGMALIYNNNDPIECRFDLQWNPKLATFRNGEHLKVRGKIGPSTAHRFTCRSASFATSPL